MKDLYLLVIGTLVTVIWLAAVVIFIWEQRSEDQDSENID